MYFRNMTHQYVINSKLKANLEKRKGKKSAGLWFFNVFAYEYAHVKGT